MYIWRALAPVTIAYITETSPDDKHAWSGTAHYAFKALEQAGFRVHALGPVAPRFLRIFLGSINQLSLKITGRRLDYRHSAVYSKAFARLFHQKLKRVKHDCIVVCGGTEYGAYLRTSKPVYYVLDRTIAGAINYHLILQDLWPFSCTQSINTDKRAMEGAQHLFFSSRWAANHARVHYGIPNEKISVVPFGANIDIVPDRAMALSEKTITPFRLLFIGSSWEHKGGAIALSALNILKARGYNCTLTVVGCTPPDDLTSSELTVIPFVDKNTEAGMKQFFDLLMAHQMLILPTRFDCTPIVFCEASAFALPVLSSETGGVAAHVKEGVNGYLLPYHDKGEGYADRVAHLLDHPGEFEALRISARAFYESTLNWRSWAEATGAVIRQSLTSSDR